MEESNAESVRIERVDKKQFVESLKKDYTEELLESRTKILLQYQLNFNQLMYMELLYRMEAGYKQLYKISTIKGAWIKSEINELHTKGLIDRQWRQGQQFPDNPSLTEEGVKAVEEMYGFDPRKTLSEFYELGEEFFTAYPMKFRASDGKEFPLKNCKEMGPEEVKTLYVKQIRQATNNSEELLRLHKKVIDSIKKLCNKNESSEAVFNGTIEKFIKAKLWQDLIKNEDNESDGLKNMHLYE
jgi:DNA-binding MarR family transcriptional regulator